MTTFKHKKRGTTYDYIGEAQLQTDVPMNDCEMVVIYRCKETGMLWVRRQVEFYDGRFERLEP